MERHERSIALPDAAREAYIIVRLEVAAKRESVSLGRAEWMKHDALARQNVLGDRGSLRLIGDTKHDYDVFVLRLADKLGKNAHIIE